jgi:mRNA-degrading endonuclease RelE of RelBE toxin-antitoxin system
MTVFASRLSLNDNLDMCYQMRYYYACKERCHLIARLKKEAEKYLAKCPKREYDKLKQALIGLENLEGDIVRLKGRKNEYRLKVPPYRILFEYIPGREYITVTKISPRGDAYK